MKGKAQTLWVEGDDNKYHAWYTVVAESPMVNSAKIFLEDYAREDTFCQSGKWIVLPAGRKPKETK